mmetsp:Transcript_43327/g.108270  ORF Transcript_43327/g.108270 Transcript_43327/m.108270 type:complete len:80 (-) Transcript_43327:984-1223(-)
MYVAKETGARSLTPSLTGCLADLLYIHNGYRTGFVVPAWMPSVLTAWPSLSDYWMTGFLLYGCAPSLAFSIGRVCVVCV